MRRCIRAENPNPQQQQRRNSSATLAAVTSIMPNAMTEFRAIPSLSATEPPARVGEFGLDCHNIFVTVMHVPPNI